MPPPRHVNPLRQNRREISAPTALNRRPTPAPRAKRACPNKTCSTPDVVDGICHSCGAVVDDSNIVAEVQFAENSSGAAVVQGSYVGADQGGVRTMGPGLRRMGGDEGREGTVRLGRQRIQGFANQIRNISENVIQQGVQIFKIAAMNNFIQGRRLDMVAAVCLYSACRKEQPCTVMLIDFADICQVNVFKLGRTFKDLHSTITISKDGIRPILPEDLVYRFAAKLEFGSLLDKVADDACRLVKRMSFDWMVMGRRPSGVCGACLVLAARMNNFRRTITEVVYVVKVTTHTIKKRLDEFSRTSTSHLTIEEFLNEEWSRSEAHDPPSFYERTEDFQKTKKPRKKRKKYDPDADPDEEHQSGEGNANKRQKTANPKEGSDGRDSQDPDDPNEARGTVEELRRDADGFAIPPRPPQYDDIPIDPELLGMEVDSRNNQEREVDQLTLARVGDLIGAFGDETDKGDSGDEEDGDEVDDDGDDEAIERLLDANENIPKRAVADPLQPRKGKKGPDNREIHVSDDWEKDENNLAAEIMEMVTDPAMNRAASEVAKNPTAPYISEASERTEWGSDDESERTKRRPAKRSAQPSSEADLAPNNGVGTSELTFDPHSAEHAISFEDASALAERHMKAALEQRPQIEVSMEADIGADEFADDPEVMNCILSAEASAAKEKIWVNENRHWLRKQQLREFQKLMAANGPPKATRNRKKKPRIGEGTSVASSPAEAAVDLMKHRSFSKKINYDAISAMFDQSPGSRLGSAATSRVTSRAGSAFDSRASSVALSDTESVTSSRTSSILTPDKLRKTKQQSPIKPASTPLPISVEIDSEPDSEDDDYVNPDATPKPVFSAPEPAEQGDGDWRTGFDKKADEEGEVEPADVDEEDEYGYENGDIDDDHPFETASVGRVSNHDFDDDGY